MDKESLQNIMEMVKEGKISPEEAAELIRAMGGEKKEKGSQAGGKMKGKLVITVTPKNKNGKKTNISIPMAFAGSILKKISEEKDVDLNVEDLMNGLDMHIEGDDDETVDIHIEK